jgi:uncharacterized membrane protein
MYVHIQNYYHDTCSSNNAFPEILVYSAKNPSPTEREREGSKKVQGIITQHKLLIFKQKTLTHVKELSPTDMEEMNTITPTTAKRLMFKAKAQKRHK